MSKTFRKNKDHGHGSKQSRAMKMNLRKEHRAKEHRKAMEDILLPISLENDLDKIPKFR